MAIEGHHQYPPHPLSTGPKGPGAAHKSAVPITQCPAPMPVLQLPTHHHPYQSGMPPHVTHPSARPGPMTPVPRTSMQHQCSTSAPTQPHWPQQPTVPHHSKQATMVHNTQWSCGMTKMRNGGTTQWHWRTRCTMTWWQRQMQQGQQQGAMRWQRGMVRWQYGWWPHHCLSPVPSLSVKLHRTSRLILASSPQPGECVTIQPVPLLSVPCLGEGNLSFFNLLIRFFDLTKFAHSFGIFFFHFPLLDTCPNSDM